MPSLGADMEVGTVVEWRVHPGDRVQRGDIVAVVDTEKSTIEVEVFEDGVVEAILVDVGEEVPVGTPLARLGSGATPAGPEPSKAEPSQRPAPSSTAAPVTAGRTASPLVRHLAEAAGLDVRTIAGTGPAGVVTRADVTRADVTRADVTRAAAPSPPPEAEVTAEAERVRASPRARRLAAEEGLDLSEVRGSGPDGAVVAGDLSTGGGPPGPTPTPSGPPVPDRHAARRRAIGALMSRAKREIPHYYLSTTVDLGTATAWLRQANEARSIQERLVTAALLCKATALAAREVPVMNGHHVDGGFAPADGVHLGVAISLRGGGLVAPAIRDAADLDLDEVMARLRDLVTRARAGTLRSSEMSDPTITVTNLGDQGVEAVFGVIYPPQVAIVGFGKVVDRPWAVDGMLAVRPVVTVTLSADHRVSDGHDGARFLELIDRYLQQPEHL